MSATIERSLASHPRYPALHAEVADFLYHEAELIDDRRYDEWLALLAEDLVYFMPQQFNVKYGQHAARETTRIGQGISWFEEDKWTLGKRVAQIQTGVHYAEEPLSRVCHMLSNLRIVAAAPDLDAPQEVTVNSRFLVYQNRCEYETYTFIGKRRDVLRRHGASWLVAKREILLDQNVLLAKNLSIFF